MTSIFERALGADFALLHPELQGRFALSSTGGEGSLGIGVMDEIWRAPGFTRPFLAFGTWRNIMFPETGRDVPFTIENWPYIDRFGRETVTFVRSFELASHRRRFDATMVYSEQRGCIVDYLGTHQHLAADVHLSVATPADCGCAPARSASTSGRSASASRWRCPVAARCTSGSTTPPDGIASRSW